MTSFPTPSLCSKPTRTYSQRYAQSLQHLIVDEYQDINYGQQRLIELLAGSQADVMVVGDDDQTIYEWRGARPNYILNDFAEVFQNKPIQDYHLSRSFRFGPLIAQKKCVPATRLMISLFQKDQEVSNILWILNPQPG